MSLSPTSLQYLQDMVNHFSRQPFQHPISEEFFPSIQPKTSLDQLKAVCSHSMACTLAGYTSFQTVLEGDKVSHEHPFFQS